MKLEYSDLAKRQLKKLDKQAQKNIKKYMDEVEALQNPRDRGKGLSANKAGLWRYRIGNYRIICNIKDSECCIFTISIGHRSNIYE